MHTNINVLYLKNKVIVINPDILTILRTVCQTMINDCSLALDVLSIRFAFIRQMVVVFL